MAELPDSIFQGVGFERVVAYLERRGWSSEQAARDVLLRYSAPGGGPNPFTILLPGAAHLSDYVPMLRRAVTAIADYEGKPTLDVLEQARGYVDVFRSRLTSTDQSSGSISLDEAIELSESVHDLLTYAAASEIRPEPFYPRKLKEAMKFADRCRFGQTGVGSFIATFYIPLPVPDEQEILPVDGMEPVTPMERRAIARLVRGIQHANEAAAQNNPDILVERVGDGLNANMCDALADLGSQPFAPGLSFTLEMDPVWRMPDVPARVRIPTGAASVLSRAARELRGGDPPERVRVQGWVYQLHHEGEHAREGRNHQIRILWERNDGDQLKTIVYLSPEHYDMALHAHHLDQQVRLLGTLERLGRYWYLNEYEGFEVLG